MPKSTLMNRLRSRLLRDIGFSWISLADSVGRDIEILPSLIGRCGASDAFAHYLLHYEKLSGDPKLKDFMHFYIESYSQSRSQWSQDVWVMYETQNLPHGKYLEVGGADGFTHSNTLALELYCGWTGTLVEPELNQFKILKKSRKNNHLLNRALSPSGRNEIVTLRSVGQLSSLKGYESADIHYGHRMLSRRYQRVKSIPLESLLSETKYDYFSFDIEGAELEVIQSVNWQSVFKPRLLTIEHNSRQDEKETMLYFFQDLGYEPCFYDYSWLLHGDIWLKLSE